MPADGLKHLASLINSVTAREQCSWSCYMNTKMGSHSRYPIAVPQYPQVDFADMRKSRTLDLG